MEPMSFAQFSSLAVGGSAGKRYAIIEAYGCRMVVHTWHSLSIIGNAVFFPVRGAW